MENKQNKIELSNDNRVSNEIMNIKTNSDFDKISLFSEKITICSTNQSESVRSFKESSSSLITSSKNDIPKNKILFKTLNKANLNKTVKL